MNMHAGAAALLPEQAAAEAFWSAVGEFAFDPLGFVMFGWPWQVPGTDLANETGPDTWQRDFLVELGHILEAGEPVRMATSAGHGPGKSALASWLMHWFICTRPDAAGTVTANTQAQLQGKTWRELSLWHRRSLVPIRESLQWTASRFAHRCAPKTWGLDAVPWSERRPEAFAGLHAEHVLQLFDEASAIPDVIYETAEGAMTTPGAMWLLFGNPTRGAGKFHEAFHKLRHRWSTRHIDARTAKMADKAQLARWVEDYGEDSDFVRVRVRGVFPRAASQQLIAADIVEAARKREVEQDDGAPLIMAVDVARFGLNESVIAFRRGRDARSIPWQTFAKMPADVLAQHIAHAIDKYEPDAVVIDGAGVGGPVIDILRGKGYRIHEFLGAGTARNDRDYANRRAETWCDTRDWLPGGAIPDDQRLADDLTQQIYGFQKSTDALLLASKEDMQKAGLASPDRGDALTMTFAVRIARRDRGLGRSRAPIVPSDSDHMR